MKTKALTSFCNQPTLRKAKSILSSPGQVLAKECSLLLSGHRYVSPDCKSNPFLESLIHSAIPLLNSLLDFYSLTNVLSYWLISLTPFID